MPVFTALAGLSVWMTTALTPALGAGFAGAVSNLLVGTTLTVVSNALLTKRQSLPKQDYKALTSQSTAPRRRGYGRMKAGGIRAFLRSRDEYLQQVVMLNHGKVHNFVDLYHGDIKLRFDELGRATNDILVTGSGRHYVRVETRVGADTSAAYSELIAQFPTHWSVDHRLDEIATAWVQYKTPNQEDFANAFPQGWQTPFQALMELSEVYDPRDGAIKYTQNMGLIIQDYLTNRDGYRLTDDDINEESFADFADLCDEATTRPSGKVEPRYWGGGFYELTDDPVSVLKRFMSACDAEFFEDAEGRVCIRGGRWDAPMVTITDRDIIDFSLSEGNDKFSAFNQLKITYTAPGQDYESAEAPVWKNAADQARRGVLEDPFEVDFVQSVVQAQRLAAIYAAKMNPKWQGVIKTSLYGLLARGERTIRIKISELGIDDTFWIESHSIAGDLSGCEIQVRSLGPEAYAYQPVSEGTKDLPDEDDPARGSAPAGVDIKVETRAGSKVLVATATPAGEADILDGQYRVDPSGAWQQMTGVAGTAQAESGPVSTGTVYGVRVRWINGSGHAGDWSTYQTITVTSGGVDGGGTDVVIDPGDWTGTTSEQIRAAMMEGIATGIPVALNRVFTLTAPISPIEMTAGSLLVQGAGRLHATADMPSGVVQVACAHSAPVAVSAVVQSSYMFPEAETASVVTIITAAGHGTAVGDWVKVVADDPIPGANGSQRRIGEFKYVTRVSGSDVYVAGPLAETYVTNIRLTRVNRGASFIWNGPRFSSVSGNEWKTVFLNVRGFLWPKIRTACEDGYSIGVNLQSCVQPDVEADVRRMLNRVDSLGISGYGVQNSGCHQGKFRGNFQDCRHFYTSNSLTSVAGDEPWRYGRSHGAIVSGHGSDASSAGFDTHSEGSGHLFAGIVTGAGRFGETASGAAWQLRGRDNWINGGSDSGSQHGGQFYSQQAGDCWRCGARDFDYTGPGDWYRVTSGAGGYVDQAHVIGGTGRSSSNRSIYVKDGRVTLEGITLRPNGSVSGTTGVMLNGNASVRLINPTVDLADYGSTGFRLAAFGSGSTGNELEIEGTITILNPGAKMSGIFSGASTSGKALITGRIKSEIAIPGIISGASLTEAFVAREGGYFSGSGDWYRFDAEDGRVLGGTARFSGSRAIYCQNAKVVLDSLHLIPNGSTSGTTGVMLDGGATVHIRDMVVDLAEFTGTSFRVAGFATSSTGNTLIVERCTVINAVSSSKFQAFVSAASTSGNVTVMDYRSDAAPVSVIVNGGSLTTSQVYNDPENFKALVTQLKSTSTVPGGWTAPYA